jgi:hypothetical protein
MTSMLRICFGQVGLFRRGPRRAMAADHRHMVCPAGHYQSQARGSDPNGTSGRSSRRRLSAGHLMPAGSVGQGVSHRDRRLWEACTRRCPICATFHSTSLSWTRPMCAQAGCRSVKVFRLSRPAKFAGRVKLRRVAQRSSLRPPGSDAGKYENGCLRTEWRRRTEFGRIVVL